MPENDFRTIANAAASWSVCETACRLTTTLAPNFAPPLACLHLAVHREWARARSGGLGRQVQTKPERWKDNSRLKPR